MTKVVLNFFEDRGTKPRVVTRQEGSVSLVIYFSDAQHTLDVGMSVDEALELGRNLITQATKQKLWNEVRERENMAADTPE